MSYLAPMNMASALEWMLRWVMTTALGDPVEPDVSCISATSSSEVSTGSTGSAASSASTVNTLTPRSSSTGTATRNGSETMTALASIMSMTVAVSLAHCSRSVRGGGLVQHRQAGAAHPQRLGRRCDFHRSTGQHADRVTEADPRRQPGHRQCGGRVRAPRTRVPNRLVRFPPRDHALATGQGTVNILSVKRLTTTSSASGAGGSATFQTMRTPCFFSCSTC